MFPKFEMLPEHLQSVLKTSNKVLSFEGRVGAELYSALDDFRKANLLNIAAKARITPLSNGRTILSYIQELRELGADRVFAVASKELLDKQKPALLRICFVLFRVPYTILLRVSSLLKVLKPKIITERYN